MIISLRAPLVRDRNWWYLSPEPQRGRNCIEGRRRRPLSLPPGIKGRCAERVGDSGEGMGRGEANEGFRGKSVDLPPLPLA